MHTNCSRIQWPFGINAKSSHVLTEETNPYYFVSYSHTVCYSTLFTGEHSLSDRNWLCTQLVHSPDWIVSF